MVKFPSEEWFKLLAEELNKSKGYEEAAKDWEGDFIFVITPGGGFDEELIAYMDLWHGKCREVRILKSREEREAAFVYEGAYPTWKKIIKGELSPTRATLLRKLKLKGSLMKLMRNRKAVDEFMKVVTGLPTEFLY
jgi:putative sterol carrier protein